MQIVSAGSTLRIGGNASEPEKSIWMLIRIPGNLVLDLRDQDVARPEIHYRF